jgi:hypothetical protein
LASIEYSGDCSPVARSSTCVPSGSACGRVLVVCVVVICAGLVCVCVELVVVLVATAPPVEVAALVVVVVVCVATLVGWRRLTWIVLQVRSPG